MLHLKADDTYLQLKKDLEYLDLKVSNIWILASFGYSPCRAQAKGSIGVYPNCILNEDVCCLNHKSFISYSLKLWTQFLVDSAVRHLTYRMRTQDSNFFLSMIKAKRFFQMITNCFFRTSSGAGVSLVHRAPLKCVFSLK